MFLHPAVHQRIGCPFFRGHRRGQSERRARALETEALGLVLDGSGFVRRSKTSAGNVAEASTLQDMLRDLDAPSGALVIIDAGIVTEANITWLKQQGYR
jgi:Transposase DDE domain